MVPHNIRSPNFLSSSSSHPLALTACWTMGNHLWLNSVWGMGNHCLSYISNCGVLVARILDTSNSRLVVSAMGFTPARGRSSPVFRLGQEKGSLTLSCHALLYVEGGGDGRSFSSCLDPMAEDPKTYIPLPSLPR